MNTQIILGYIIDACRDQEFDIAHAHAQSLFNEILKGQIVPVVPPKTYIGLGDGSPLAFAILSHPNGKGADFIRYEFDKRSGKMEQTHRIIKGG